MSVMFGEVMRRTLAPSSASSRVMVGEAMMRVKSRTLSPNKGRLALVLGPSEASDPSGVHHPGSCDVPVDGMWWTSYNPTWALALPCALERYSAVDQQVVPACR